MDRRWRRSIRVSCASLSDFSDVNSERAAGVLNSSPPSLCSFNLHWRRWGWGGQGPRIKGPSSRTRQSCCTTVFLWMFYWNLTWTDWNKTNEKTRLIKLNKYSSTSRTQRHVCVRPVHRAPGTWTADPALLISSAPALLSSSSPGSCAAPRPPNALLLCLRGSTPPAHPLSAFSSPPFVPFSLCLTPDSRQIHWSGALTCSL